VTVHAGTPASVLGIEAGDIITAVDGSDIVSAAELRQMLARHGPGDRTSVTWTDSRGHRHTVVAQLSAGPAP
jgi:S1-C subfamily serine protease